jgi:hypothetical protein
MNPQRVGAARRRKQQLAPAFAGASRSGTIKAASNAAGGANPLPSLAGKPPRSVSRSDMSITPNLFCPMPLLPMPQ